MEAGGGSGSEESRCGRRQSEKQADPTCYAGLRPLRSQGLAREGLRPPFEPPRPDIATAGRMAVAHCRVTAADLQEWWAKAERAGSTRRAPTVPLVTAHHGPTTTRPCRRSAESLAAWGSVPFASRFSGFFLLWDYLQVLRDVP